MLSRMGCALAVRRFAGLDYTSEQIGEYAWIIRQRKEALQASVRIAEEWLDDLWQDGARELQRSFAVRVSAA